MTQKGEAEDIPASPFPYGRGRRDEKVLAGRGRSDLGNH